jgi:hypothetical protein
MKLYRMVVGSLPCMKNYISLPETMYGPLFPNLLITMSLAGTQWIFKNKSDEHGTVIRNKARLVAQGYTKNEGVDFDETFAPIARLESIRILLTIACHVGFRLY